MTAKYSRHGYTLFHAPREQDPKINSIKYRFLLLKDVTMAELFKMRYTRAFCGKLHLGINLLNKFDVNKGATRGIRTDVIQPL